ncbi:MAG: hemerythrin domain-containing protein [Actinobacteria bacterium]|nr:hemerythrin domain-containing protein [Actinomycetota bacterium]
MRFETPHALKAEHDELHETLRHGTKESGALGAAAVAVAELMHPHFLKEEEYALPPLALLGQLAHGAVTPEMTDVLALTDKLRAALDEMLTEHQAIVDALEKLSAAAKEARKTEYVEFAEALTLHAQTEEEVTYPAAILVGDYVRKSLGVF